jgi:parallel beta-helix repeat protein
MKSKSLVWFVAGVLLMLVIVQSVQAAETYVYITKWGSHGTGDGDFNSPRGISVNSTGYVYISDGNLNRIQIFDPTGVFKGKWGTTSDPGDPQPGTFFGAYGTAVDSSDNIYVVDTGNDWIQVFDPSGGNIRHFFDYATNGHFGAVNSSGYVFISETLPPSIDILGPTGTYVGAWSELEGNFFAFTQPSGVAVDAADNVYVADIGSDSIQKFAKDGTLITQWGSLGSGNSQFNNPLGIAIDPAGNVYVADSGNNRIQKFDSNGAYLTQWGSAGTGDGNFNGPIGVAVDTGGNVYVIDADNYRIQKFAPTIYNQDTHKAFETIQDAIEDAGTLNYHTITVASGTYVPFSVTKALTIKGIDIGGGLPVVSSGSGNAIYIAPVLSDVTLEGFNVISSTPQTGVGVYIATPMVTVRNVAVTDFYTGIYIDGQINNRIEGCSASGNINGIWLNGGSNANVIDSCTLTNGALPTSSGILIGTPTLNNIIQYCEISQMTNGIVVGNSGGSATNNYVDVNFVHNNNNGIMVYGSSNSFNTNTIVDNNNGIGIYSTGSANGITNNYFRNNLNANPVSNTNTWNFVPYVSPNIVLGPNMGGNYWEGSPCSDTTPVDGFCDSPYVLDVNNIDLYPLWKSPSGRAEAIDNGKTYLDPSKDKEELKVSDDDVGPGTGIKLINGQIITSPDDGSYWVEFINLAKNDNWGHPAKLIFHTTGKADVVYDVDFPPSEENIVKFLHEGGNFPNAEGRISINLPNNPDFACTPNADHNYAVLIAGGTDSTQNYARYYSDVQFLYKTLIGPNYGYSPSHIKVVMSDGTDPGLDQKTTASTINSDPKLDGTNSVDIKRATKVNVTNAISTWSPALTSADTLFIFTTGHGQKTTTTTDNTNDVRLLLWGTTENITDTELVAALPAGPKVLMMMEQCYAGGFKDEFIPTSGSNIRVLATAARGDQVSHSNEYSYYFITAMAGKDSAGILVDADKTPVDGQISMREAHTYANNLDPSRIAGTETPQFFEWTTNPAAGSINYASTCAASKSITVTIPSGVWVNHTVKKIQWATSGFSTTPTLKIELMNASGWQADISASVPGTAAAGTTGVDWTVPDTLPGGSGPGYYVLISTISTQQGVSGKSSTFSTSGVLSQWPGALKVTSSPTDATIILRDFQYNPVKINNVEQINCKTEWNWTSIAPAKYWVKAVKTCYQDVSFAQKQVNPNTTTQAPFTLVSVANCANPGPIGSIAITSLPKEGFRVWLKGGTLGSAFVDMGYETPVIQDVEVGTYSVRLEANGYIPQEKEVTVMTSGDQARADFTLLKDPAWWYTFTGFDSPVDMGDMINTANAGKNIPLKWHLSDEQGYVSDPKRFNLMIDTLTSCSGSATDEIEVFDTATPVSGLTYQGNGAWHYNWKTEKGFAGKCKNVYLKYVNNGQTTPVAKFKFR